MRSTVPPLPVVALWCGSRSAVPSSAPPPLRRSFPLFPFCMVGGVLVQVPLAAHGATHVAHHARHAPSSACRNLFALVTTVIHTPCVRHNAVALLCGT